MKDSRKTYNLKEDFNINTIRINRPKFKRRDSEQDNLSAQWVGQQIISWGNSQKTSIMTHRQRILTTLCSVRIRYRWGMTASISGMILLIWEIKEHTMQCPIQVDSLNSIKCWKMRNDCWMLPRFKWLIIRIQFKLRLRSLIIYWNSFRP